MQRFDFFEHVFRPALRRDERRRSLLESGCRIAALVASIGVLDSATGWSVILMLISCGIESKRVSIASVVVVVVHHVGMTKSCGKGCAGLQHIVVPGITATAALKVVGGGVGSSSVAKALSVLVASSQG